MTGSPPRRNPSVWDRAAIALLVLIGLYVVIAPGPLGWDWLEGEGLAGPLTRVLLGFLFLFQATSLLERNRLRARLEDLVQALNMLLYGKDYRRDRDAVQLLIRALKSDDGDVRQKAWENLKRLTGQDFALDPPVWEAWWRASEKRFAVKRKRPDVQGEKGR